MSEPMPPPPQDSGGGSVLTRRYLGVPGIVWIGGVVIIAYFLFFRKGSSSGSAPSSSGGGGTSTTGDITFNQKGSNPTFNGTGPSVMGTASAPVTDSSGGAGDGTNNPGQGSLSGTPNPQPTPDMSGRSVTTATAVPMAAQPASPTNRTYTVKKGDTLASIAKMFGISIACLAHANVYVKGEVPGNAKVGQTLGTGAGLLTGQILKIPSSCLHSGNVIARQAFPWKDVQEFQVTMIRLHRI